MKYDDIEIEAILYPPDVEKQNRNLHEEAKKAGVPMKGPWSGNNNLGFELDFDLSSSQSQTILRLSEWGMPSGWILSLLPRIVTTGQVPLGAGDAFDAILEISFGSGGVVQTFECDICVGTRVSLPTNAIDVKARLAQADANAPEGVVKMSALLARGYARTHATRSFLVSVANGEVTPSSSDWVEIPPFAKSVQMVAFGSPNSVYGGSFQLELSPNTSAGQMLVPGTYFAFGPGTRMPIPAFMRYARVTNTSAVNVGALQLLFNIFAG